MPTKESFSKVRLVEGRQKLYFGQLTKWEKVFYSRLWTVFYGSPYLLTIPRNSSAIPKTLGYSKSERGGTWLRCRRFNSFSGTNWRMSVPRGSFLTRLLSPSRDLEQRTNLEQTRYSEFVECFLLHNTRKAWTNLCVMLSLCFDGLVLCLMVWNEIAPITKSAWMWISRGGNKSLLQTVYKDVFHDIPAPRRGRIKHPVPSSKMFSQWWKFWVKPGIALNFWRCCVASFPLSMEA